jgi:hypothetical protein
VDEKKKSDSEFLSYYPMLYSGKKNSRFTQQKKYSNSGVVRKHFSKRNKKPLTTDMFPRIFFLATLGIRIFF